MSVCKIDYVGSIPTVASMRHIRCRQCEAEGAKGVVYRCFHSSLVKYVCYTRRGKYPVAFPECDTCKDRFKCLTTKNWTEWIPEPERYEVSGRYKTDPY